MKQICFIFLLPLAAAIGGYGVGGNRKDPAITVVQSPRIREGCLDESTGGARRPFQQGMMGGFFPQKLDLLSATDREPIETAATKAVEMMNAVKTENGASNAMPIKFEQLLSAQTQVVAGMNYDLELQVSIDGQSETCFLYVTNLEPWIGGGTWSVEAQCPDDPCSPFIPPPETSNRKRRSAHLLGGEDEADKNDARVQAAAKWAVQHLNEMSNSLFTQALLKITHVTKQVVNGMRYRFLLTVVSTSCRNNAENRHKTLEDCPANDEPKPQDCDVTVIYSQGKYSMEDFKCKARKASIGGDDHDYKPHGMIGGDDHDYKPHGMIGGDDHDYKPHGMIGGDDHDYKPHRMIGGDDHDYKPHGMIGGDDHDYKPHGMIGGDDHDYRPHGEHRNHLLGQGLHDYIPHGSQFKVFHGLLNKVKDSGIKEEAFKFGKDLVNNGKSAVKHMSILGGDTHDYLPHGDDKCAEHLPTFKEFKNKYNKLYESPEVEATRFRIFCDNMEKVKKIRMVEQGSATYGATKFADLSEEEFRKNFLGFKLPTTQGYVLPRARIPTDPIPESWDWRDHGAVTPVKNQGWCGSCWAFSTTGNIEGQWAIKSKQHKLLSLSEQELVDCDKIDQGCNGGFPLDAYKAIMELGGIETEQDYKYTGRDQTCHFNKSEVVVKLTGAVNISKNEDEMAAWLYKNGPISIGINSFPMQFYFGGISHPWKFFCDPHALDHGVLIVGYGKQGSEPYWIIKNSWGEDWGRDGYYYIYRGDGSCGLNTMCTSATVM